jgi:hypothetical protein
MLTALDTVATLTTSAVLHEVFPQAEAHHADAVLEWPVLVIPQGSEPRWIIVGDAQKTVSVLRSWRPYNLGSRIRWSAVSFAASARMLAQLPGVQSSHVRVDPSYWQTVLPGLTANWNAVIHVGSPSYTRKATVFFIAEDRQVKAVVKVPLTRIAGAFILNEADVLFRMRHWQGLPQVLFQDPSRGIAAQTWLMGRPVSRSFTHEHLDLLCRFANPGATIRISDYSAAIASQLNALDSKFDRDLLSRALELLDFNEPLPAFVEHRDFAPWNLKRLPDGRLGLVDWEWAVTQSLPWQDVCRFFYMSDVVFTGPGNVWESMCANPLLNIYRKQFAIRTEALRPLTMYYLLRVLCMDAEIDNSRLTNYTYRQIQLLLDAERESAEESNSSIPGH